MNLRKRGFPQLSIEELRSREWGQVNWSYGMFMILFFTIYLFASLKTERIRAASAYLEDALTASNLASAVVDIEEFGISNTIRIIDTQEAYARYLEAVKGNLNLRGDWTGAEDGIVSGKVRVVKYIIYNVTDSMVETVVFDENGKIEVGQQSPGDVRAPDGTRIESTSVYSEIAFGVELFPGICYEAHKGELVDVVG